MRKTKIELLVALAFTAFFLASCATNVPPVLPPEERTRITNYAISPPPVFTEPSAANAGSAADHAENQNTKYVFVRLYNVTYKPSCIWGRVCKTFIDIYSVGLDGFPYEHSAVSYKLSDEFYGLTGLSKNYVKKEEVSNIMPNAYMKTNNAELSYCTVLAIPCTETDYENCKKLIDFAYDNSTAFHYSILGVLKTPFIRSANIRNAEKHGGKVRAEAGVPTPIENTKDSFSTVSFSCSGFCAYILTTGVQRFKDFAASVEYNPHGATPAEFFEFDGAQKLFTCRYTEYDEALKRFIEAYPQFEEYL